MHRPRSHFSRVGMACVALCLNLSIATSRGATSEHEDKLHQELPDSPILSVWSAININNIYGDDCMLFSITHINSVKAEFMLWKSGQGDIQLIKPRLVISNDNYNHPELLVKVVVLGSDAQKKVNKVWIVAKAIDRAKATPQIDGTRIQISMKIDGKVKNVEFSKDSRFMSPEEVELSSLTSALWDDIRLEIMFR